MVIPTVAQAAFPGANGLIAFETNRDGNAEIYTMNADGSGQTNLTGNPATDVQPNWSPDGTKIAFVSDRGGDGDVYVMNADGSGVTNLTKDPASDIQPHWSPDGTKIAFDRESDIYTMNADGSGQTNITNNPFGDTVPTWSPDGTRIAFRFCTGGPSCEIWVMNADGSNRTQLTFNGLPVNGEADWSPDGTKLAFPTGPAGSSDIYFMESGGGEQTNLTNSGGQVNITAVWSPDGAKIAFASHRDGNAEIYTMNADGSGQTRLTVVPNGDGEPDWQPLVAAVVYDFDGFFRPVDNLPALNAVKAGSSVPVKFSLAGNQGLDILAAGYPKSEQITCGSNALVDGIEETTTPGGSSLAYDASEDMYTYVWKTSKSWGGTCRQLVVKLDDGTSHRASFRFK